MQSSDDKIKQKIFDLYRNYGLDWSDMTEEELERLVTFYSQNKKMLDSHYQKSEEYSGMFSDDDVI